MALDVSDLVRLASVGGFTIDGKAYAVEDLVRIAQAAEKGTRIHILNASLIPIKDLLRIAGAGAGLVSFDLAG